MVEKALPAGPPAPPPDDLPAGFRVKWDPGVRRFDGGAVVVGGIPRRVVRLSAPAAAALGRLGDEAGGVGSPAPARLVRPLLDAGLLHPVPGPAALGVGQVTVVVPVRDRAEALARMLRDLGQVAAVVVVDDGSTDASAETAAAWGAEVVRRSSSGGPAAARNAGLARVGTPLVAFVDSDVGLDPGWLEGLLAHFNDPSVALVAPRVIGDTAGRSDALARYELARSPVDLGPHPGYVRPGNRVSFLPAAVLVARTAVARALDGFDEALRVGEDVDFVWRVGAAGWRVRYEPAVLAHHETRRDFRAFLRQRVLYGTSAAALHRRHPGRVAPIAVSPWSAALWAAALAGRLRLAGLLGLFTLGRLERR
ncbi:MAG: mycofactocin biosynthesis glycosyltransferase MftF, partial [Acidimicrobiia bacterium]|nr:mycofactocin biosynthesis glycosyltransferase MftF [Acidimicrobiia bacterium]